MVTSGFSGYIHCEWLQVVSVVTSIVSGYKWFQWLHPFIYIHILKHIGRLARMSILDTEVVGSNPRSSMLFH